MQPSTRNTQSKLPERTEPSLSSPVPRRRQGQKKKKKTTSGNFTERAGTSVQLLRAHVTLALALLRLNVFLSRGGGGEVKRNDRPPSPLRIALDVCVLCARASPRACPHVRFVPRASSNRQRPEAKAGPRPSPLVQPRRNPSSAPRLILFPHGRRRSLRFRSQAVRRASFQNN